MQVTCDGCFACQSIHLIIPLQRVQDETSAGVFAGGRQTLTRASLGFPFRFSLYAAS